MPLLSSVAGSGGRIIYRSPQVVKQCPTSIWAVSMQDTNQRGTDRHHLDGYTGLEPLRRLSRARSEVPDTYCDP